MVVSLFSKGKNQQRTIKVNTIIDFLEHVNQDCMKTLKCLYSFMLFCPLLPGSYVHINIEVLSRAPLYI